MIPLALASCPYVYGRCSVTRRQECPNWNQEPIWLGRIARQLRACLACGPIIQWQRAAEPGKLMSKSRQRLRTVHGTTDCEGETEVGKRNYEVPKIQWSSQSRWRRFEYPDAVDPVQSNPLDLHNLKQPPKSASTELVKFPDRLGPGWKHRAKMVKRRPNATVPSVVCHLRSKSSGPRGGSPS